MPRYFLFFTLVLISFAGQSQRMGQPQQQFATDFWHDGKVVLETNDTIRGQVKYNLQSDIIQFQSKGHLESYTPRKVVFFEIFDKTVSRYRDFYSLPYSENGTYKAPAFFELLDEGKLTLLSRETLEYRTYTSYSYYGGGYTRLVLITKYFFLKEDGTITAFVGNKGDFYSLLGDKEDRVKRYAKDNKLDYDKKYGLAAIVNYYNSLFK